jgi:hypothetical protein
MFARRILELRRFPRDLPTYESRATMAARWLEDELFTQLDQLKARADEIRRDEDRSPAGKQKALSKLADEYLARITTLRDKHQNVREILEEVSEVRAYVRRALGGDGPLSPTEIEVARILRERAREIGGPSASLQLVQEVLELARAGDTLPAQVVMRAPSITNPVQDRELRATLELEALRTVDADLARRYEATAVGENDLTQHVVERFNLSQEIVLGETRLEPWSEPDPMSEQAIRARLPAVEV